MNGEKMGEDPKRRRVLVVATTKLCVDGLTSVLMEIAGMVSGRCRLDFALAESAEQKILAQLSELGRVYELPSRRRRLPIYLYRLSQLMKENRYDIVHIHGNSATMAFDLAAAWRNRIPKRITHIHNCAKQPAWKQKTLGRIVNRWVTDPAACSDQSGKMLYDQPFTIIPNGIDCEMYHYSESARIRIRGEFNIPEKALVIGHIGRFSEQKNQKRLIRIFSELTQKRQKAFLLLAGTGEMMEECRELVQEAGLKESVLFAGAVENPQDFYSAMDVLVMPSLFEGLPLVGVEAQASGLPCVFSDRITRETRILPHVLFVPLEADDDAWADAILSIPKNLDRGRCPDLIRNAGFSREDVRARVAELYGI